MTQLVQAIYENGVFRPLEPVTLPEHEQVSLTIQGSSAKNGLIEGKTSSLASLPARYAIWADMSDQELAELETVVLSRSESRGN